MDENAILFSDNVQSPLSAWTCIGRSGDKLFISCALGDVELDCYELLALAVKMEEEGDSEACERILNFASTIFHPDGNWVFNTLYGTVRMDIAWMRERKQVSEPSLHNQES